MAEINFLCVHKKLRAKRLAPLLIKEITRRVNLKNVWQAVFTAGVVIPTPITTATYYHRSLNPKKLVEVGFSALPAGTPMARYVKMHKMVGEDETGLIGTVVPMEQKHTKQAFKLLQDYLKEFDIYPEFSKKEFQHFCLPRENVLYSYVIVDEKGEVTDFFSFYHLPSSVLKSDLHKSLSVSLAWCDSCRPCTVSIMSLRKTR